MSPVMVRRNSAHFKLAASSARSLAHSARSHCLNSAENQVSFERGARMKIHSRESLSGTSSLWLRVRAFGGGTSNASHIHDPVARL